MAHRQHTLDCLVRGPGGSVECKYAVPGAPKARETPLEFPLIAHAAAERKTRLPASPLEVVEDLLRIPGGRADRPFPGMTPARTEAASALVLRGVPEDVVQRGVDRLRAAPLARKHPGNLSDEDAAFVLRHAEERAAPAAPQLGLFATPIRTAPLAPRRTVEEALDVLLAGNKGRRGTPSKTWTMMTPTRYAHAAELLSGGWPPSIVEGAVGRIEASAWLRKAPRDVTEADLDFLARPEERALMASATPGTAPEIAEEIARRRRESHA